MATKTTEDLGKIVSDALAKKGLSPSDLKASLHISSSVLEQLLYYGVRPNVRPPKPNILRTVAEFLGLDVKLLFGLLHHQDDKRSDNRQEVHLMEQYSNLGELLEHRLRAYNISSNKLSELAGVSQGTIHNLLKQGRDSSVPGPHPRVLRAICEVLVLDQLEVFQLVGYIDPNYRPTNYTTRHSEH
jgi:DNA-binding Xre family transcriptional regulator